MGGLPMPVGMGQLGFVRDQRAAGIANRHPDTPAALRVPVVERYGVQAQKFSNTRFDSHASNLMHGTSALIKLRHNKGWILDPRSAMNKNDARAQLEGNATLSDLCLEECKMLSHGGDPEGCGKLPSGFHGVDRRRGHAKNLLLASLPRSKSKAMATTEQLSNFKWFSTLRVRGSHRCPS